MAYPIYNSQFSMTPASYTMGQPFETEEQRRRRLAIEAAQRGESTEVTPIKQTITIDPVTGEQKMKLEGSVADLSAANPMTPTVVQPVAPQDIAGPTQDEILRDQEMARLAAMPPQAPTVSPGIPVSAPAVPETTAIPAQPQDVTRPTQDEILRDQEMARLAARTAPAPSVAPVPPTQVATAPTETRTDATQAAPAQTRIPFGQAIPESGVSSQPVQTPKTNREIIVENQNNIDKLYQLAGSGNLSSEDKIFVETIISQRLKGQKDYEKAQATAQQAFASGDPRAISRAMRGQEGSWLKAIMFGYGGAQDLAREELNKLGYGGEYRNVMIDGHQAYVRTTEKGQPLEGRFLSGPNAGKPLDENQLMGQSGTGKDMEYVGGTFVNDVTGQVGRWATNKKTGQQSIMTDKGPVSTEGFRPQGVEGSLYDRYNKLEQDARFKFRTQSSEQNLRDHSRLNETRIMAGLPAMTLSQRGLNPDGTLIGQISGTANAPGAGRGSQVSEPVFDDRGRVDGMPRQDGVNSSLPKNVDANPNQSSKISGGTGQVLAGQGKSIEANMEAFVKYKNDDLLPKAEKANNLSNIRRQQISGEFGILNRPEIAGLLSGTGTAAREFQNIFRDIIAGNYDKVENMSARIASINQPQPVKDALYAQLQFQREVTPNIIREVAPVGTITDFEQRMAKDAGIDITRTPLYPALYNLTRSQFSSDMAQYKAHFAALNPQLTTREAFDREWNKEKARMEDINRRIIQDRTAYIKANGSTNGAILESFKDTHYPVPQWDNESRKWIFGGYSQRATRRRLQDFER